MRTPILLAILIATCCSSLSADVCVLGGGRLPFRSTGSRLDSGGWEMKANGYMGTFLAVPKPERVEFSIRANGRTAVLHFHVGDRRFVQSVDQPVTKDFKFKCFLPAGLHRLRIELSNPQPRVNSYLRVEYLTVNGAGVQLADRDGSDAQVLQAADSYIENYRKGGAEVLLTTALGKPVPARTSIHIKLHRHAFNFGTAVYGTNAANGDWLQKNPAPGSDAFKYQEFVKSHFNIIVPENAGKWGACEDNRDVETMGFVDSMLKWAAANGLRARMHCVFWGQSMPPWSKALLDSGAKDELRKEMTGRINCLVRGRADKYIELDGINESAHQDGFLKAYGYKGLASIYDEIIKASAGRARVYFNEYNLFQWNQQFGYKDEYANWYKDHIEKILNSGVSPANRARVGIGMQYYPSEGGDARNDSPHSPVRIAQVLQTMSIFELPMSLTEFATGGEGEPYAPQLLSDTMRLVFGSDQTTSFLVWGFWKPHMWANGSALVDEKWNLTQTGKTYEQLLGIHDWGLPGVPQWTTDLTLKTDRKGKVTFRGFYGDYDVTVNGHTYPLRISKDKIEYSLKVL